MHSRPPLPTAYEGPRDELDRGILNIWQRLLGIDQLGIHDNFFELGGHSLLLTQMRGELQRELNVEVPVTDLFRYPTIATLSEFLSNRGAQADALQHVSQRADFRRDSMRRRQEVRAAARLSSTD